MKIVHVCRSDYSGGADRAAYRIHRALVEAGYDSAMRVLRRGTEDPRVEAGIPIRSRLAGKIERRKRARSQEGWRTTNMVKHSFGHSGAGLLKELNRSDADVLNLQWAPVVLSVEDIGRLEKPIVWTLHDMWAFCGGEHYDPNDGEDARFRQGYLASNRPPGEAGPDLNRQTWEAKRRCWAGKRFTIVSPSRWLADCAAGSILLANAAVHVIPNALDTDGLWRPLSREVARAALRLPADTHLLLMGADGGTVDPRKGGDLLREAIDIVAARSPDPIELVIYGQSAPSASDRWPCPVHWLGTVNDDAVLVQAYSAADVLIVPSRQDNLPNASVEGQACGTPIAAFEIGGLPDVVSHRVSGWLAKPFDVEDLAEGVLWMLADPGRRGALSSAAREHAVATFAQQVVAEQYAAVYRQVLEQHLH